MALSNSKLVLEAAPKIARRLEAAFGTMSYVEFIERAFEVITGVQPSSAEIQVSIDALEQWRALPEDKIDTARTHFVWALLNHNDFVTLR